MLDTQKLLQQVNETGTPIAFIAKNTHEQIILKSDRLKI